MDDTELYREQVLRHAHPVVTGHFVGFGTTYTRTVRIGGPLVTALFLSAAVGRLLLRRVRRSFKDLKKGPEYAVTPIRLRDDLGQTYEIEMLGQLPQSALYPGDLVQATTRPQPDPALPVRLVRVVNLETRQLLTPRIPTLWSHIGPGVLLQATLGLILAGVLLAAWIG